MYTSDNVDKIMPALVKFHAEAISIVKNKEVPGRSFSFKYADLESILAAVRPVMAKCELIHTNAMLKFEEEWYEVTRIYHTTGQWVETRFPIPKAVFGQGAQAIGAQKTYGRRYNLLDLIGLSAEDDNDGEVPETAREKAVKESKVKKDPEADEMRALFMKIRDGITNAESDLELKEFWKTTVSDMDKLTKYNRTGAQQLQDRYDAALQSMVGAN